MKKGFMQSTWVVAILSVLSLIAVPEYAGACLYNKCFSASYGSMHQDEITINLEVHGYSLGVAAGDVVIIRANHNDNTFNPYLNLISPHGNLVAADGIPGTGVAEIVTSRLNLGGVYTIVIKDQAGNGKGSYCLSVQSINRPENARILQYSDVSRDTLSNISELKAYQFIARAGDIVDIQMIGITDDIDPHIRLFNPSGRLLASAADNDFAIVSSQVLPDSGMYTIIADDVVGDDVGEYFLILLKVPTDVDDEIFGLPAQFALYQNHPNPFNPLTTIGFSLLRSSAVGLEVYNILGENIRSLVSGRMPVGTHSVIWDGRDENGAEVPTGIYFYRLETDEFLDTKKMLLLK